VTILATFFKLQLIKAIFGTTGSSMTESSKLNNTNKNCKSNANLDTNVYMNDNTPAPAEIPKSTEEAVALYSLVSKMLMAEESRTVALVNVDPEPSHSSTLVPKKPYTGNQLSDYNKPYDIANIPGLDLEKI
jgi:hypothetical protein